MKEKFIIIAESCDLNPIEMVWNQLKRYVVRIQPHNKDELIQTIQEFWTSTMTVELCNRYINHVFKVAPVVMKIDGKATGDLPNRLFNDRSEDKDLKHYVELLNTEDMSRKLKNLTEDSNNQTQKP